MVSEERLVAGEDAEFALSGKEGIFGSKEAFSNLSELPPVGDAGASPPCPKCNSNSVWRDGLRSPMFGESIQRWLCRDCGFRFSDPADVERERKAFEVAQAFESKTLKSNQDIDSSYQIWRHGDEKLGCGTTVSCISAEKCSGSEKCCRCFRLAVKEGELG